MAKSEKLYNKSPSIKKDENGKAAVHKPKEADAVDMGIEGAPLEGAGDGMKVDTPHDRHLEMLERHQAELKDMQKRHTKEAAKLAPNSDKDED